MEYLISHLQGLLSKLVLTKYEYFISYCICLRESTTTTPTFNQSSTLLFIAFNNNAADDNSNLLFKSLTIPRCGAAMKDLMSKL